MEDIFINHKGKKLNATQALPNIKTSDVSEKIYIFTLLNTFIIVCINIILFTY